MTEIFIGTVEDLNDPLQLGRARVRVVNGYQDDIETEDLLWATVMQPTTSAGVKQIGSSPTGLIIGSRVVGIYIDGTAKQQPLIMGTFSAIPQNDQTKHDVSQLARGTNTITNNQVGPEPGSSYGAEYPHNKTLTTESGHVVEIDDTPGKERINIRHKSGSYVEINNAGQVVIKSVDNQFNIVTNDEQNYVGGDRTDTVKGAMTINVTGEVQINGKNITTTATKTRLNGTVVIG